MTTTRVASMVIDDVELRVRPSFVLFEAEPMDCDHAWEPHIYEHGRAYCPSCGSFAHWVNDPRLEEEAS